MKYKDMDSIKTINPANGSILNHYSLQNIDEANDSINASHQAFLQWRQSSLTRRIQCMQNIAFILDEKIESLAKLITSEMGKPITQSRAEIKKCKSLCDYYIGHCEDFLADKIIETEHQKSYVSYQPLGTIFAIMPWNYPFWQVFRFAVPNVLAGNTALVKHASISCGAGQAIKEIFMEAGFPIGVFNTLIVNNQVAEAVISNPNIAAVTLTGSEKAGQVISQAAGYALKKVVMELGGSDPYLVLADADLDLAAEVIVNSRLNNTGQVCIAAKRILVDTNVHQALVEKIQTRVEAYRCMDPMKDDCRLGPMARDDLRKALDAQVQQSIQEGAQLLMGGSIPQGKGFYYPATILDRVEPGMVAFDEELFGPVIAFTSADDEQRLIALANTSVYGLGAAIFTSDTKKGEAIARDSLEAGSCFVNTMVASDPRFPFGGIKRSGYGRELAREGMHEFLNIKTVVVGR